MPSSAVICKLRSYPGCERMLVLIICNPTSNYILCKIIHVEGHSGRRRPQKTWDDEIVGNLSQYRVTCHMTSSYQVYPY